MKQYAFQIIHRVTGDFNGILTVIAEDSDSAYLLASAIADSPLFKCLPCGPLH
jgi:hypothetical protein